MMKITASHLLSAAKTTREITAHMRTTSLHSSLESHELGGREADKLRRLPASLALKLLPVDDRMSAMSLILLTTVSSFFNTTHRSIQHHQNIQHFCIYSVHF